MLAIAARPLGAVTYAAAAWNTAALAALLWALVRRWRPPDLDPAWTHGFFERAIVGEHPTAIFQFIITKVYVQYLQDLK
jgi:hypothetical protein